VIPLDLFCDLGHVLFSPEGNASAMGDAALARVGRKRRVMMTLPVFSGVYRAVAGSDMIALLPRQLAQHVAQSAGIAVYAPPMPIPPAEITMVWHRRHDASPAHLWLRAQISEILAPLDAG
jgi:DNA-binding transcriptional LysR family regulator